MTNANPRKLWGATLLLAGIGALVSACGPQDGSPADTKLQATATKPTADKPPSANPAATKPAPEAAPVAQANHTTGAVQRIEPITETHASGGAVAGPQVEKQHNRKVVGYRVQVQLDNGETRTFEPTQIDGLKVGDRVRVEQGHLRRV